MNCAFCRQAMTYVHGHAACIQSSCPFFGVNQAECCDGEIADGCVLSTADLRAVDAADNARMNLPGQNNALSAGASRAPTPGKSPSKR